MSLIFNKDLASLPVAVLLAVSPPMVDAGVLVKTISKELTGRIATRQAVSSTKTQVLSVAEREAYQRILHDLDIRTLRTLEVRYGSQIPRETLIRAQSKPSILLDEASYQRWLRVAYPRASHQELRGVVGDTHPLLGSVTVNRNQVTLVRTLAHERVHQLAHPRFSRSFGNDFDEGATDYFAARVSNDLHLRDATVGYPVERELAGMLAIRVGEVPLARAYFRGEFDDLVYNLERDLGAGSFVTLQGHLQRNEFNAARILLLGKNP